MSVRSLPLKSLVGLVLGFGIGAGCRLLGIPVPAPNVLLGAFLVVSMTLGYVAMEWWMARDGGTQGMDAVDPAPAVEEAV